MILTCLTCGQGILSWPSKVNPNGNYCSFECAGNANHKLKKICVTCGKEFYVSPINSEQQCCSVNCSYRASPRWKGGLSFGKYCPKFNEKLKARVRAFFNHECVLCHKSEDELGYRLSVHHVDYEKDNCYSGTLDPLFVPLCSKCHPKTNYDRDEWELFFRY